MVTEVNYPCDKNSILVHDNNSPSMECSQLTFQSEFIKQKGVQHLETHHNHCLRCLLKSSKRYALHMNVSFTFLCNFTNEADKSQSRYKQGNRFLHMTNFMQSIV